MKVLNVAEKNDAAKSIAAVMSRNGSQRREGYSQYNKIYQFDYMLQRQHVTMVMTSVSGHLQDMEFAGQYRNWQSCSPLDLFDAPILRFVPERFEPIKRTLEREARGAKKLIIWTDCDREGENIGFEIIDVVKKANPTIQVLRARFSEITNTSINRAIANLVQPDERQNAAVEVRRELDLRIGAAFTRFLTLRYQPAFPELADLVISYGSCQFPTLGFVVERYKQIQEFIVEPFWKLKAVIEEEKKHVDFSWKRVRLFDYDAVRALYEMCVRDSLASVTDVKKKSKSKWRPVALDTVEFEKNMCKKLKISAKRAMQIAEKLYTSGYISYPRTETNIFPKDLNLRDLVQNQTNDNRWGDFAGNLLQTGISPRNGKKSDQAHPPIHPLKHASNLNGDESRVYEFIVRHFLACCSQDARGFETTVEIQISSEKFTASGLVILERNYLDVYPYERWSDKDIPDFNIGDVYQPLSIEILGGETSPPNLLTEADLITLMEKHGIGTDATHAEHIDKIQERNYVGLHDNKFLPGTLGMGLVEGYDALGFEFSKPHLRAGLENDLKLICEGRRAKGDVLPDQIKKYREKFEVSMRRVKEIDEQMKKYLGSEMTDPGPTQHTAVVNQPNVRKCPSCGSNMVLKQKSNNVGDQNQPSQVGTQATSGSTKTSYFISCMGYPQCKTVIWLPREMVNVDVTDRDCAQCAPNTKILYVQFKPGSVPHYIDQHFTGCIMCDENVQEVFNITVKSGQTPNTHSSRSQTSNRAQSNHKQSSNRPQAGATRSTPKTLEKPANSNRPNERWPLADIDIDNKPVCLCGEAALQLTVKKDGPNHGRPFYKCGKGSGDGSCNFFLWADQPQQDNRMDDSNNAYRPANGPANRRPAHGSASRPSQQIVTYRDSDDISVSCNCNQPAKRLTVQKEGSNKGREFYGCPKPRNQGCKFFQWADENPENGQSAQKNPRGSFQQNSRAEPSTSGKRKCGHCRQEGHTKKKCPNLS